VDVSMPRKYMGFSLWVDKETGSPLVYLCTCLLVYL
jgi:hypothetical protein